MGPHGGRPTTLRWCRVVLRLSTDMHQFLCATASMQGPALFHTLCWSSLRPSQDEGRQGLRGHFESPLLWSPWDSRVYVAT